MNHLPKALVPLAYLEVLVAGEAGVEGVWGVLLEGLWAAAVASLPWRWP